MDVQTTLRLCGYSVKQLTKLDSRREPEAVDVVGSSKMGPGLVHPSWWSRQTALDNVTGLGNPDATVMESGDR